MKNIINIFSVYSNPESNWMERCFLTGVLLALTTTIFSILYIKEIFSSIFLSALQFIILMISISLCALPFLYHSYKYFAEDLSSHIKSVIFAILIAVSMTITYAYASQVVGNVTKSNPTSFRYSVVISAFLITPITFTLTAYFLICIFGIIQMLRFFLNNLSQSPSIFAKALRVLFIGYAGAKTDHNSNTRKVSWFISFLASSIILAMAIGASDLMRIQHFGRAVEIIVYNFEMYDFSSCTKSPSERIAYLPGDKILVANIDSEWRVHFSTRSCKNNAKDVSQ